MYADVVVVGAGAAGLQAARSLQQQGISVLVVEAADYVGGRLKYLGYGSNAPLQLGAELVHGPRTVLADLVRDQGWEMVPIFVWAHGDGGPSDKPSPSGKVGYYYIGSKKKLYRYDQMTSQFQKLNEALWEVETMDVAEDDSRNVAEYLRDEGVSEDMIAMAEAGYANTMCSRLRSLPLLESHQLATSWEEEGEGDFLLPGTMKQVVNVLSQGLQIILNWPVTAINYSGTLVRVVSKHGHVLNCKKVVVTVPIPVLQSGDIVFEPPMPIEKRDALQKITMFNALKIIVQFTEKFWPADMNGMICSHCEIPELWFKQWPQHADSQPDPACYAESKPMYLVTAFATADYADRLGSLQPEAARDLVLKQLDEIFGHSYGNHSHSPASDTYWGFAIQNWSKEPYVRGGYSSPARGGGKKARSIFNAPMMDRVFFAGEASQAQSYMTVHSAMETGLSVAKQVTTSLQSDPSTMLRKSRM